MARIWLALFLGLLSVACPLAAAQAAELRIVIEGMRSSRGSLLVGLYDSKESFDHAIALGDKESFSNDPSRTAGAAFRANDSGTSGIVFMNIKLGRYSIIVVDDENGNGILDKNFFGVPTEPYGFSNKAQGFLGPPSFDDAAIEINGDQAVVIDLVTHASGVAAEP
jgi:uncharacterized protein (DUF2141 family)